MLQNSFRSRIWKVVFLFAYAFYTLFLQNKHPEAVLVVLTSYDKFWVMFLQWFPYPLPPEKKESLNLLYLLSTFRTFLDEMLRSIFVGMQAGWTNPLNSFRGLVLAAKGRQQETERLAYLKNMFMIGSDFWRDSSEVSISTSWCLDSMFLNPRLLYIKGLGFPQQKVWIKHNPSINC